MSFQPIEFFKSIVSRFKNSDKGRMQPLFQFSPIFENFRQQTNQTLDELITDDTVEYSERFYEFIIRLDRRYVDLKVIESLITSYDENIPYTISDVQLEFVNRTEAYFQQVYASISAFILLINRVASPEFKHGMSIRSVEKFLTFLESKADLGIENAIFELKRASKFRSKFVDHVQQHALHDWMTVGVPNLSQRQCVVIYFIKKGPEIYSPWNGILDPYDPNFDPCVNHEGFYVSPPHDEVHKAFFFLAGRVLEHING